MEPNRRRYTMFQEKVVVMALALVFGLLSGCGLDDLGQSDVVSQLDSVPDAASAVDEFKNIIPDEGVPLISSNWSEETTALGVVGIRPAKGSPATVIRCEEGREVLPLTTLHLSAVERYLAKGEIIKWKWSVEQPVGSVSRFVPSDTSPDPTFETNVAGVYRFSLETWNADGVPSWNPAFYDVFVIPGEALYVELVWHTPEDLDESDTGPEAGSDLDLHFLHRWAAGPDIDGDGAPDGWFDNLFDCFWFNAHPNWGSYDPTINDDPGLDRDDTDGGGPECINLDIPEQNATYRVGVHYWNDHSYGPAHARVRVYIYSFLVFEAADVVLLDKDMWEVCTIDWPSGAVYAALTEDGDYVVTPRYENPYFFQD